MKSLSNSGSHGRPRNKEEDARSLYLSILTTLLQENHHLLKGGSDRPIGYIRSRRFDLLYKWAELTMTDSYRSAHEHFAHVQIAALITKYPFSFKEIGLPDPRQTGIEKFLDAEERCRKTNNRFSRTRSLLSSRFYPLIEDMRRFIASVIGDEPNMEAIYHKCGFGSGANVGVHGNSTNLGRKLLSEKWTCTRHALKHVIPAMWSNDQMAAFLTCDGLVGSGNVFLSLDINTVSHSIKERYDEATCNLVSFVPKTAKTHRAIAIEPTLNTYIQRGIDSELRDLLRKAGYDLSDQGKNAAYAKIGSITGSLGTLDLSSASDTVASSLVYRLLPYSWFRVLNDTRSHRYTLKKGDDERTYHKFASMGNGFCFPLETLIFAAAVRACKKQLKPDEPRHAIYGDDIIASVEIMPLLISLLKFLGFKPNEDKTFYKGPFRESCGADWYEGQDVRPVYLDYHLSDATSLMIFHNATLRSERAESFFDSVRPLLRAACPSQHRFLRPDFGIRTTARPLDLLDQKNLDGAFTVPIDVFMASRWALWSRSQLRWKWKEFLFTANEDRTLRHPRIAEAQYLAFLSGQTGGRLALRYSAKRRVTVR